MTGWEVKNGWGFETEPPPGPDAIQADFIGGPASGHQLMLHEDALIVAFPVERPGSDTYGEVLYRRAGMRDDGITRIYAYDASGSEE